MKQKLRKTEKALGAVDFSLRFFIPSSYSLGGSLFPCSLGKGHIFAEGSTKEGSYQEPSSMNKS